MERHAEGGEPLAGISPSAPETSLPLSSVDARDTSVSSPSENSQQQGTAFEGRGGKRLEADARGDQGESGKELSEEGATPSLDTAVAKALEAAEALAASTREVALACTDTAEAAAEATAAAIAAATIACSEGVDFATERASEVIREVVQTIEQRVACAVAAAAGASRRVGLDFARRANALEDALLGIPALGEAEALSRSFPSNSTSSSSSLGTSPEAADSETSLSEGEGGRRSREALDALKDKDSSREDASDAVESSSRSSRESEDLPERRGRSTLLEYFSSDYEKEGSEGGPPEGASSLEASDEDSEEKNLEVTSKARDRRDSDDAVCNGERLLPESPPSDSDETPPGEGSSSSSEDSSKNSSSSKDSSSEDSSSSSEDSYSKVSSKNLRRARLFLLQKGGLPSSQAGTPSQRGGESSRGHRRPSEASSLDAQLREALQPFLWGDEREAASQPPRLADGVEAGLPLRFSEEQFSTHEGRVLAAEAAAAVERSGTSWTSSSSSFPSSVVGEALLACPAFSVPTVYVQPQGGCGAVASVSSSERCEELEASLRVLPMAAISLSDFGASIPLLATPLRAKLVGLELSGSALGDALCFSTLADFLGQLQSEDLLPPLVLLRVVGYLNADLRRHLSRAQQRAVASLQREAAASAAAGRTSAGLGSFSFLGREASLQGRLRRKASPSPESSEPLFVTPLSVQRHLRELIRLVPSLRRLELLCPGGGAGPLTPSAVSAAAALTPRAFRSLRRALAYLTPFALVAETNGFALIQVRVTKVKACCEHCCCTPGQGLDVAAGFKPKTLLSAADRSADAAETDSGFSTSTTDESSRSNSEGGERRDARPRRLEEGEKKPSRLGRREASGGPRARGLVERGDLCLNCDRSLPAAAAAAALLEAGISDGAKFGRRGAWVTLDSAMFARPADLLHGRTPPVFGGEGQPSNIGGD